jgi:hypothetical protein
MHLARRRTHARLKDVFPLNYFLSSVLFFLPFFFEDFFEVSLPASSPNSEVAPRIRDKPSIKLISFFIEISLEC